MRRLDLQATISSLALIITFMETTKLAAANTTNSLRITIPMSIVKHMKLEEGGHIEWEMDKDGKEWIAAIRKKG